MGRAVAQVAAVFTARTVVQIPTFKALKEIKVDITSNLVREVSSSSSLDIRATQNS